MATSLQEPAKEPILVCPFTAEIVSVVHSEISLKFRIQGGFNSHGLYEDRDELVWRYAMRDCVKAAVAHASKLYCPFTGAKVAIHSLNLAGTDMYHIVGGWDPSKWYDVEATLLFDYSTRGGVVPAFWDGRVSTRDLSRPSLAVSVKKLALSDDKLELIDRTVKSMGVVK